MLQRGRGAGYLAALDAPRETVGSLLIECITNDPRLDQQCEDRAEYYASLILATGMDLAPIYSLVKQNDNQEDDLTVTSTLPMETLTALAERGSGDAVQMLRDYVSSGSDWTDVVMFLGRLGEPAALDGMDEAVCHRIISNPAIQAKFKAAVANDWRWYCGCDAEDRRTWSLILPICEPWKTLCRRNRKLADLFEDVGIPYDQPPPPRERLSDAAAAAFSLDEMFACVDKFNWGPFRRVLPEKVSPGDEDLLLENLSSDDMYRAILAFRGLAKLGTLKAFEAVKRYIEDSEDAKHAVRRHAFMAIAEMPGSLTLDTGRQWFRRKEWYLHVPGGDILENHATLEDVPLLIEALRTPETVRREDFRLGGALDALARFGGIGSIPEVEQIFCQAPSCFDRCRAANAMAVTAPARFCSQYAFECLWDCHWNTRVLGCENREPFEARRS